MTDAELAAMLRNELLSFGLAMRSLASDDNRGLFGSRVARLRLPTWNLGEGYSLIPASGYPVDRVWRCEENCCYAPQQAGVVLVRALATPRRVLRCLRRIQAATAWCRARQAGQQRAAAEIARQQAPWVDQLAAEAAGRALG